LQPSQRWPVLPALLAELTHDPVARRRSLILRGAVVAGLVGVSAAAFTLGRRAAAPELCAGADNLVANLWTQPARAATQAAFRATGRPDADETFARVDESLRQRLGDWAKAHHEACEATQVRHEQSAELLDARMACLARAKSEIGELVSL